MLQSRKAAGFWWPVLPAAAHQQVWTLHLHKEHGAQQPSWKEVVCRPEAGGWPEASQSTGQRAGRDRTGASQTCRWQQVCPQPRCPWCENCVASCKGSRRSYWPVYCEDTEDHTAASQSAVKVMLLNSVFVWLLTPFWGRLHANPVFKINQHKPRHPHNNPVNTAVKDKLWLEF